MLVAGQHHDIIETTHLGQQPAALRRIGGPSVDIIDFLGLVGIAAAVERHHHDLLRHAIPLRLATLQILN